MKNIEQMHVAYIGLGSNLGDRAAYINSAMNELANSDSIYSDKMSRIIETTPLGGKRQPDYFNCVLRIKTRLSPEKLLDKLQSIEGKLGRVRTKNHGSRTIDLDILLYGDKIIDTPRLQIPHPYMHLRSFVLDGICEIDPSVIHPILKQTEAQLKSRLNGQDFIIHDDAPKLISIAGIVGVGKTTLARGLAVMFDAMLIEENYEDNPYLAKVYDGQEDMALKSELYFVNSSASQLGKDKLTSDKLYVNDYIFEKAFAYANRWLDDQQMLKYKAEYAILETKVTKASVVIYLKDSINRCLERIHLRNRPYEQDISLDFLQDLEADYDKMFKYWKTCPVITIDAGKFNTADGNSVRTLAQEIKYYVLGKKEI